ncbi:MAG: Asp-tRNA(Asn)/Glu-tRNA(Gln) amidotransferase subunit GatB [Deltaproteobacteria bacterium]|nr:Asp-tRNA(Asn)/Glu-tRNA(Gln) amidotransferase subunit GatB [Deltaproteobacteria bacterium]
MTYEPVIGLEVHAQLKTKTKIFCSCSTAFGAPPNTHTCPVCLGMPGVLPVLNKKVVEYALCMGLATNCTINRESRFARKNYFYPDLPKGYQISQYELPIAENGFIEIEINGHQKRIGITRIHMEEDAGKLSHDPDRPLSKVDFNRTGVPLIEIVSEPDIRTPEEAGAYLRHLRSIVRYLGISDGNMEEGSFRCDANISIRPKGSETLGTRETRLWDPVQNKSISMRGKEEAHDYRYFPDPDLLPLVIDDDWIDSIRKRLPELPDEKKKRFMDEYGLPSYDSGFLTSSHELADYFEACVTQFPNPKPVSNWIMGALLGLLNAQGKPITESPISPGNLAQLLQLIDDNIISGKIQVTDESAIKAVVVKVLEDCSKEVEDYKNGKTKLFGFFVGQVMKETKGKANPKIVNEILKDLLSKK